MASSHNKDKNSDQMQKEQNNESCISRAKHKLWLAACSACKCKCYGWQHAIPVALAMGGCMHINYGMWYGWQHANLDAAQIEVSPWPAQTSEDP